MPQSTATIETNIPTTEPNGSSSKTSDPPSNTSGLDSPYNPIVLENHPGFSDEEIREMYKDDFFKYLYDEDVREAQEAQEREEKRVRLECAYWRCGYFSWPWVSEFSKYQKLEELNWSGTGSHKRKYNVRSGAGAGGYGYGADSSDAIHRD